MKKILLLITIFSVVTTYAQRKEKIKGNKEVLIKKFTLPYFNIIEVGESFEIALQKSTDTTSVVIETDDNLFDVIHYKVEDEILKFSTSMEIVKKKRLRITVFVPEDLKKINVFKKGKIFNEEILSLKNLEVKAVEKAKVDLLLDIKDKINIEAKDKANVTCDITTKSAVIHLTGYATLNSKINVSDDIVLNIDDHAVCELKGTAKYLKMTLQAKSEFDSEHFKIKKAEITAKDRAKTTLNVEDEVVLKLTGKTETFLWGNPKINLKVFNDNAALFKK